MHTVSRMHSISFFFKNATGGFVTRLLNIWLSIGENKNKVWHHRSPIHMVAGLMSRNTLDLINVVALRNTVCLFYIANFRNELKHNPGCKNSVESWAQLVPRWVTICRQVNHLGTEPGIQAYSAWACWKDYHMCTATILWRTIGTYLTYHWIPHRVQAYKKIIVADFQRSKYDGCVGLHQQH